MSGAGVTASRDSRESRESRAISGRLARPQCMRGLPALRRQERCLAVTGRDYPVTSESTAVTGRDYPREPLRPRGRRLRPLEGARGAPGPQGRKYDARRRRRSWWTEGDVAAFRHRADCIRRLYSGFRVAGSVAGRVHAVVVLRVGWGMQGV